MTNYEAIKPLYEMDGKDDGMTVSLYFDKDYIAYLKKKFDIEDKQSLLDAIYECISTYMEL